MCDHKWTGRMTPVVLDTWLTGNQVPQTVDVRASQQEQMANVSEELVTLFTWV